MFVNALVTGLIVFKILKVFLEVNATLAEGTLGSLSLTRRPKLRHIVFIIIESGMALFAIQLVRVVMTSMVESETGTMPPKGLTFSWALVIIIHQVLNVIIRSVDFSTSFVLLMIFTWLGDRTNNNFGAGFDENVLR